MDALVSNQVFLLGINNAWKIKYNEQAKPPAYEIQQEVQIKMQFTAVPKRSLLLGWLSPEFSLSKSDYIVWQANSAGGSRSRLQIMTTGVMTEWYNARTVVFTTQTSKLCC